jgi:hypothetical protein
VLNLLKTHIPTALGRGLKGWGYWEPLVVGTDRNFISSEMAFYDKDESPGFLNTAGINLFGKEALMYQFCFRPKKQTGKAWVGCAGGSRP